MSQQEITFAVQRLDGPSIEAPEAVTLLSFEHPGVLATRITPDWRARWDATCHALGLSGPEQPREIRNGMDLVAETTERLLAGVRDRVPAAVRPAAHTAHGYLLSAAPSALARRALPTALAIAAASSEADDPAAIAAGLLPKLAELRQARTPSAFDRLHPVTAVVADAARAAAIACRVSRLYSGTLLVGEGARQVRFDRSLPLSAPSLGSKVSADKILTKRYLAGLGIPVLPSWVAVNADDAVQAADRLGYPVVLKPVDGSLSQGVALDVRDAAQVAEAFDRVMQHGTAAMIEPYLAVSDFRATVIGGRIGIVMRRNRPYVVGDGRHSIAELIERHNADLAAGRARFPAGYAVTIDDEVRWTLQRAGLTAETVPAVDAQVFVRTAPVRTLGGYPVEVTADAHAENIRLFERIAAVLGMPIVGIDFRAEALERPWQEQKFAILEANARASITDIAADRLAAQLIAATFPDPAASRLPTLLVLAAPPGAAAMLGHLPELGYAGPDGTFLGGTRFSGQAASLAAAHDRIAEDPTAEAALHWADAGRIASRGLGLARIDHAFLPATPADARATAVHELVRRHADRVDILPDGFSPDQAGAMAPILAAIERLSRP